MAERTREEREERARCFDSGADLYDRARPKYPREIFDDLWRLASLGERPRVVEVGCGTGQASIDLVKRGAQLTCVEMGPNMAALARSNLAAFPDTNVINSRFEDWDPRDDRFDLMFASASWHWMDPDIRYSKAASVLRPGGSLAVLASKHAFPPGYDPLFDEMQKTYAAETGSSLEWPPAPPETIPDKVEEMVSTGLFARVQVARRLWHLDLTADEFISLLSTFSDNRVRPKEERERLFCGIRNVISSGGGRIRKHYLSILRVATVPG